MDHSQQDIDQLISLYLSRQASVGQRQALEEWLASSSENRATFHRLEKIWAMSIPMEYDRKMAVIGEGNINFERVFAAAERAGTKYMLVEQDDCNGEDPFVCLKRSFEYLKACGF